jgi:mono/diheme cytochrome c family protein
VSDLPDLSQGGGARLQRIGGRAARRFLDAFAVAAAFLLLATAAAAQSGTVTPSASPDAAKGQGLFAAICSTCHGVDASGIAQMGKDLRKNAFLAKSTVPQIVAYIHTGHPPTQKFPEGMPPGGNSSYDDAQLADIAAWLKTLQ